MELKRVRGQHGPILHFSEEVRKRAITRSKTKYMTNKEWRCSFCCNYNYTLAGKHCHLKSQKHHRNANNVNTVNNRN